MKEFPPFRLDTDNQCLWRRRETDDERIVLTPKAFSLLRYLVEHPGRLVTHRELLDAVWRDTHVQPEVLKTHILEIRRALGDDPKKPLFIETSPRRGYGFIAAVREDTSPDAALRAERTPDKLVGRDQALGELRECLRRTLTDQRQVVFITGEPGIGKTALVDELRRQAAAEVLGIRIASGQCIEGYGGKEAYYPMLEALSQLCRGSGGDSVVDKLAEQAPTWLVQFPALLRREHREALHREVLGATRERMLREIGEALETVTSRTPLLLIFEDVQWLDHSTVDLISALARRRAPARLMLIATYRPVDVVLSDHPLKTLKQDLLARRLCHEVALEPLDEADVAEYLAAGSSRARLPEGLAGLVYRHSEGNPLFMVAALDHMTARGLIAREHGHWELEVPLEEIDLAVPETLREMIEAQIDRLPVEDQRALEATSVIGAMFSTIVGTTATDLDADHFEDLCERLSRRHHIVRRADSQQFPGGTTSPRYEFVHALYREVFYRRQAPGRRAMLHRRIGERVEALFTERLPDVAPELAHHFEEGADWSRAVKYLRLAAETAGRRFAPGEATVLLHHALQLSSKLTEAERAPSEIAILGRLATIYQVSFDMRALEAYEALRARAADYGMTDVEVRALLDMAYPLSWMSAQRCLEVVERALRLSAGQRDPLMRARTRASALVRRIWAGGWNARDAEECQNALAEIRASGDRLLLASHLIDCNFIQWVSSEYRVAHQNAVESLAILVKGPEENPYLSFAHWLSQFTLPWSLLFLGEWGEALRTIEVEIEIADKNGDRYRAQTLHLYRAWVHLHAMDFLGVVAICDSVFPSVVDPARSPWRRFCLVLAGSAEAASGNDETALKHLSAAAEEMDRHMVIHDWYCRMMLLSALTELWLGKADLGQARLHAERFLTVTLATAERTWQALAWEANARVAIAERDPERTHECIAKALSTMEGFDVPLAAWRVHRTAAKLYERTERRRAEHHRERARATILQLAHSLPAEAPLRTTFLSAASVREILEDAERA